jgi:accessory gene regulator protein AgrB
LEDRENAGNRKRLTENLTLVVKKKKKKKKKKKMMMMMMTMMTMMISRLMMLGERSLLFVGIKRKK